MLAAEADYADREARLQEKIDNIESSHPGYDEYRYNLDMIGHDPMSWRQFSLLSCKAIHATGAQARVESCV